MMIKNTEYFTLGMIANIINTLYLSVFKYYDHSHFGVRCWSGNVMVLLSKTNSEKIIKVNIKGGVEVNDE